MLARWTLLSNNTPMRTIKKLRADLKRQNVQLLARVSGVYAKTIYRIRSNPEYTPGVDKVERLSSAIDRLAKGAAVAVDEV